MRINKFSIRLPNNNKIWITVTILLLHLASSIRGLPSSSATDSMHRVDPLALLSATLRTYQTAGCESEQVSLNCPHGTGISVELVQYGNDGAGMNLCPARIDDGIGALSGTEIEIKPPESCLWPNALQYSLLQTASEACQKKRHCKFTASARAFGGDPCPGVKKFVEVAFKCRPYEFRSKVACENDVIQLVCNPYSRIAIYSASYGRTEYESIQCAQPLGVKEETCLVSYATETVMQKCHGRRRCTLSADSTTFGKPCHPDSRMYLKVVYTCVPRKVLKDVYDTAPEPDEPEQEDFELETDELYDDDQFYRENEAIPPAPKLQGDHNRPRETVMDPSSTQVPTTAEAPLLKRDDNLEVKKAKQFAENDASLSTKKLKRKPFRGKHIMQSDHNSQSNCTPCESSENGKAKHSIGFVTEWINAYIFLTQNQEKFYLYLIISVTAGILLCLTLLVMRLLCQRRRSKADRSSQENETSFQKSNTGETTLPNGFSDDISEIDADIDLTATLPISSLTRTADHNYGIYTPSPSPFGGNIGSTNLSHTSTTMLVPMHSQPHHALMGPPPMGTVGTLPRYGPPTFLSGSVIGPVPNTVPTGTLGRQSMLIDGTTPRSLSRGAAENAQYYYG